MKLGEKMGSGKRREGCGREDERDTPRPARVGLGYTYPASSPKKNIISNLYT